MHSTTTAQYQPVEDCSPSFGVPNVGRRRLLVWLAGLSFGATLCAPLLHYGGRQGGDSLFANLAGGTSACEDAYNSPGYIYRGEGPSDIRWIPYEDADFDATPAPLEEAIEPPRSRLDKAPPSFNEWIQTASNSSDLDFMRGRTVVFVGDSHDRRNIEGFCAHHKDAGGMVITKGGHVATRCHLPVLNFTMASWFHYGLAEENETWYMTNLSPTDNPPPYYIEGRMNATFMPDIEDIGQPDLIILNSIYWDLRYVVYKATHEEWSWQLKRVTRPMTFQELAWHRRRLRTMVELFQRRFPGVPLMFRVGTSLHLRHERANNDMKGNVAIYQMNESAKETMKRLGIPIFPWGELLQGETDYADVMHVKPLSQPTYLVGDMALYYLRRTVNGWNRC
ncbi:hypothetical protein JCM10296v2_007226 [Rhodotorula toruloides]